MEEEFFGRARSIQEIAERLNTTELFIRKQIEYGRLKAHKFDNRLIRIMPEDLRDWLERAAARTNVKPKPAKDLQSA
jgi:excisionase family DNA binding protein